MVEVTPRGSSTLAEALTFVGASTGCAVVLVAQLRCPRCGRARVTSKAMPRVGAAVHSHGCERCSAAFASLTARGGDIASEVLELAAADRPAPPPDPSEGDE